MVLFYVFISLMGVVVVDTGIYRKLMSSYDFNNTPILPYVLCFVCNVLLLYPLKYIKKLNLYDYGIFVNPQLRNLIKLWVLAYLFFTILRVNEAIQTMSLGLADSYTMRHIEGIKLFQYTGLLKTIYNLLTAAQPVTVPFIMFYSIIGIRKHFIKKYHGYFLIVVCFFPALLGSLANGSRGALFMVVFCFLFFVITFWNMMDNFVKRDVRIILIAVLGFGLFYSWLISLDRAKNADYTAMENVIRYFGEPFPNLVAFYWEKVRFHPMGLLMFNDFYPDSLTKDWTPGEKYRFWSDYIGVPTFFFKTFFGHLYMEFGAVRACLFTFCFGLLFRFIFEKLSVNLITLPLVYLYFQLCVYSFAGFSMANESSLHYFIGVILIMWLLPKYLRK